MTVFRSIFSSLFKDLITSFISKATGNWNVDGEITWEQPGFPEAGDPVSIISTHIISLIRNEAAKSVSVAALAELIIGIYNLVLSGSINIFGTLTMGVSADKGLKQADLIINSGATVDLQTDSDIYNSGNYSCHNSAIWANNNRGHFHKTASGNFVSAFSQNRFFSITNDIGVTLTVTASSYFMSGGSFINNGIIALGNSSIPFIGVGATGSFILGVSSDITGTGVINMIIPAAATYTNNYTGTFSFAGVFTFEPNESQKIPTGDWTYASFVTKDNITAARTYTPANADDIRIYNLSIAKIGSHPNDTFIANSAFNNDWYIGGSVDLQDNGSGGTSIWSAGLGSAINHIMAGSETANWNGQVIDALVINGAGVLSLTGDVATASLTVLAGTFSPVVQNIAIFGNFAVAPAAIWNRGTGTITLTSGNANFDPDGQTIEKLIVTGATKTVLATFTTAALDVPTGGILDLNNISTIIVEGDLDGNGTIQSPTPVNLTVNGNNNFTGTLTNVTII